MVPSSINRLCISGLRLVASPAAVSAVKTTMSVTPTNMKLRASRYGPRGLKPSPRSVDRRREPRRDHQDHEDGADSRPGDDEL